MMTAARARAQVIKATLENIRELSKKGVRCYKFSFPFTKAEISYFKKLGFNVKNELFIANGDSTTTYGQISW